MNVPLMKIRQSRWNRGSRNQGRGADYAHPITTPLIYLPKNGGDEPHVLNVPALLTNDNSERDLESQGMYGRGE